MHLSPAEREEFKKLSDPLLRYATGSDEAALGPAELQAVYGRPEVIEAFLRSDQAPALSERQKTTLRGFSDCLRDDFYLVKQYKKYAVLLHHNALFGVVGVEEAPTETIGQSLPTPVEALLLPFNETIVVAGMTPGREEEEPPSRSDIEYEFKQIKDVRGITETLDPQVLEAQSSPGAQRAEKNLRQYLRSAATREKHAADIQRVLDKYPELHDVYMQMYSKISARQIKKELKANGIRERHFAVYNNSVVAVAATRGELLDQLSDLSFDGRMGQCALFRL
jgi:hypothetical protein